MKNILLIFVFVLFGMETIAQTTNLNNGLVAYYPFNGNANDESGKGNNGTVNGATLTADRNGKQNQAYYFDGLNNYVRLPELSLSGSFSLSLWIRSESIAYGWASMITKWNHNNNRSFTLGIENNKNIGLGISDLKNQTNANLHAFNVSYNAIGVWKHICAIYNMENGTRYIYIDGILQGSKKDESISIYRGTATTYLGTVHLANEHFFKGKMDDVRIYNRVLSDTEIQELYQLNTNFTAMQTENAKKTETNVATNSSSTAKSTTNNTTNNSTANVSVWNNSKYAQYSIDRIAKPAARLVFRTKKCDGLEAVTRSGRSITVGHNNFHHRFEDNNTGEMVYIYDFEEPLDFVYFGNREKYSTRLKNQWGYEHIVTYNCKNPNALLYLAFDVQDLTSYELNSEQKIKSIDEHYFKYNCKDYGNSEGCAEYLAIAIDGQYRKEAERLQKDRAAYEKISSLNDCKQYLQNFPNGKFASEVAERQREYIAKAAGKNKNLWKLGSKLCYEDKNGIIAGTLNQWNEDKSMAQIKVILHPGGSYEGEKLERGTLLWINAVGSGWHTCTETELKDGSYSDKGDNSCYSCKGRGSCIKCLGSGFIKCSRCDGKGVDSYGRFCSLDDGGCNGKQQVVCYTCKGNKVCSSCNGRGKR